MKSVDTFMPQLEGTPAPQVEGGGKVQRVEAGKFDALLAEAKGGEGAKPGARAALDAGKLQTPGVVSAGQSADSKGSERGRGVADDAKSLELPGQARSIHDSITRTTRALGKAAQGTVQGAAQGAAMSAVTEVGSAATPARAHVGKAAGQRLEQADGMALRLDDELEPDPASMQAVLCQVATVVARIVVPKGEAGQAVDRIAAQGALPRAKPANDVLASGGASVDELQTGVPGDAVAMMAAARAARSRSTVPPGHSVPPLNATEAASMPGLAVRGRGEAGPANALAGTPWAQSGQSGSPELTVAQDKGNVASPFPAPSVSAQGMLDAPRAVAGRSAPQSAPAGGVAVQTPTTTTGGVQSVAQATQNVTTVQPGQAAATTPAPTRALGTPMPVAAQRSAASPAAMPAAMPAAPPGTMPAATSVTTPVAPAVSAPAGTANLASRQPAGSAAGEAPRMASSNDSLSARAAAPATASGGQDKTLPTQASAGAMQTGATDTGAMQTGAMQTGAMQTGTMQTGTAPSQGVVFEAAVEVPFQVKVQAAQGVEQAAAETQVETSQARDPVDRIDGFTRGALAGPAFSAYGARTHSGTDKEATPDESRSEELDDEDSLDVQSAERAELERVIAQPEQALHVQTQPMTHDAPRFEAPLPAPAVPVPQAPLRTPEVEFIARPPGSQSEAASISIHHPDLGPIQLEVHRDHGRVEVHAVLESVHAEAVLRANESGIRQGVQQSGMTFSALRVRVRGEEQPTARPAQARSKRRENTPER